MRIMIVGAGRVGHHLSEKLAAEGMEVILVDRDESKLRKLERELNILAIHGNGASARVLEEAGIDKTDLFIAATDSDEINIVACIISKQYKVKTRIARVRSEDFFSQGKPVCEKALGIDLLISPDLALAEEIIQLSTGTEAFEVAEFSEGQVVLLGYMINEGNPFIQKSLSRINNLQGIVVAVVRQEMTIIPRGDDNLLAGDKIYLVVRKEDVPAVEKLFSLNSRAPKQVFIIGGNAVAFQVARRMEKQGISVKLIDKDKARCEYLTSQLEKTVVLNFDGLEANDLLQEGIDQADLVISLTNSDTANILSSLLAKHHGAKKCITHISRPDFIPMLGKLGIDVPLSRRLVAANMILRYVRGSGSILSVATLLGSDAEVIEIKVPNRRPFLDTALKSLTFPKGGIVGAVVRDGVASIATGTTKLRPHDTLVLFFIKKARQAFENYFAA